MRESEINKVIVGRFLILCLVYFWSLMNWRYKAYNSHISEIFSVSDEAFAMLLLENNYEDYKMVYNLSRKVTRKESKPKYTKDSNLNEKFKGWSQKGLKRYDKLVRIVTNQRRATISLELEEELKNKYASICGKMTELDREINETDEESKDEDYEVYDGFEGERIRSILDKAQNVAQL